MPLATLGLFVFDLAHATFQQAQRESTFRHPSTSRIGKLPARQYTGPGDDTITLSGTIYPEISSGGKLSVDVLRGMAAEGKAWPYLLGTGELVGLFVIETVSETGSIFFEDGTARKIEFSLTMKRVDEANGDMANVIGNPTRSVLDQLGAAAASKPSSGSDGLALYSGQTA